MTNKRHQLRTPGRSSDPRRPAPSISTNFIPLWSLTHDQRAAMKEVVRGISCSKALAPATLATIASDLARVFDDLAALGYRGLIPRNLSRRHLEALVAAWRGTPSPSPRTLATTYALARRRWVALRHAARVLDRHSVVPTLSELWPEAESAAPRSALRLEARVRALDDRRWRALIEHLSRRPGRRVHVAALHLIRDLALDAAQGLTIQPRVDLVVDGNAVWITQRIQGTWQRNIVQGASAVAAAQLAQATAADLNVDRFAWPTGHGRNVDVERGVRRLRQATVQALKVLEDGSHD